MAGLMQLSEVALQVQANQVEEVRRMDGSLTKKCDVVPLCGIGAFLSFSFVNRTIDVTDVLPYNASYYC